jgi:hypothetical protein
MLTKRFDYLVEVPRNVVIASKRYSATRVDIVIQYRLESVAETHAGRNLLSLSPLRQVRAQRVKQVVAHLDHLVPPAADPAVLGVEDGAERRDNTAHFTWRAPCTAMSSSRCFPAAAASWRFQAGVP